MTDTSSTPAGFYDQLAPYYHLLYSDWDAAVQRQGEALARLLEREGIASGAPVLDAACGIGTQAIGLAERGYHVHASDVSPGAVARLREDLRQRGLHACVAVDDLRRLDQTPAASQAAVIACDNSIPHLLSDADILQAFKACHRCLQPGGLAVFSVRDYATVPRVHGEVRPYGLRVEDGHRFLAVQAWEWDGDQYDLRMYLTHETPDGVCATTVLRSRYYAVTIDRLLELMQQAGFVDVRRSDDVLFQPVLTGRRAGAA